MMKTKLTLFVAVLAVALFGMGCASLETTETKLKQGLVAYYPFNGNANDESGNGNHGKIGGDAQLSTDRFGNPTKAFEFDGENDYIVVDESPSLLLGTEGSISFWVLPRDLSGWQPYISKDHHGYNDDLGIGTQNFNDNDVIYIWFDRKKGDAPYTGFRAVTIDEWIFVCGTWHSKGFTIYRNGVFAGTNSSSVNCGAAGSPFLFATEKTRGFANCKLDEIRIYNRALSATEVKALYDLEKPKGE